MSKVKDDNMKYRDSKGREYFIDCGISRGNHTTFATYYRKPTGSLRRVRSPKLAPVPSRAQAQTALDIYAAAMGWEVADG